MSDSLPVAAPAPNRLQKIRVRLIGLLRLSLAHAQRVRATLVPTERQRLFGLTILIGGVCGLAAVAFHQSIDGVARLTIERAELVPGWGGVALIVGVPAAGALLAGALMLIFPNARGSGIPQVKIAYRVPGGVVRLRDAVAKFFIGTLQIGTGSALGREGPTVQICSGVATYLGRLFGLSPQNVRRLLPVGTAAGIAAAFNAPIAAVTFTIEEIVGTLDQTLLSGVIVAAALAAVVERSVLGTHPIFDAPPGLKLESPASLLLYAGLGVAAGLVSIGFKDLLIDQRAVFRQLQRVPVWARPALGALSTGGAALVGLSVFGSTGITGGGYTTLGHALWGGLPVTVMLGLCLLKLLATSTTYASGGAGGIFAPTLFIGGMLGGVFGSLDIALFAHSNSELGAFALVGMGALFAGFIRAPITSVLIIIEMTDGYSLILPLMIANMSAYAIARRFRPVQIYDALIRQDGISLDEKVPDVLEGATVAQLKLDDRPHVSFTPRLSAKAMLDVFVDAGEQEVFPVLDEQQRVIGIITLEDLTTLAAEPNVEGLVNAADLMRPPVSVRLDDKATVALERMGGASLRELPVLDEEKKLLGFIDEVAIARAVLRAREAKRQAAEPA